MQPLTNHLSDLLRSESPRLRGVMNGEFAAGRLILFLTLKVFRLCEAALFLGREGLS